MNDRIEQRVDRFWPVVITVTLLTSVGLGACYAIERDRAAETAACVTYLRVELAEQRGIVEMQQSEIVSLRQQLGDATSTVAAVMEDNAALAEAAVSRPAVTTTTEAK